MKIPDNLVHAAFFFTDIVGLSDPIMSSETQTTKIKVMNNMIKRCKTFKEANEKNKIILPTGDGMAIGFLNGLEQPLELAIEFHEKIIEYNDGKTKLDKILVRIGCHVGSVFLVEDISGNLNFWGAGIILARRTMDIGDEWHILLTSSMAESLIEVSSKYKKILHPLHDYEIKHEQKILIYSAHGEKFGNKNKPRKGLIEKSIITEKMKEQNYSIIFDHVIFELRLEDKQNKMFHKRTYEITNQTETPIYEITTGITTSMEKSFYDLDVKVWDEEKQLEIKSINVDTPFTKEFTVKFDQPLFKNIKRKFIITYVSEVLKNKFENEFLINANLFDVVFSYSSELKIKNPKLEHVQNNIKNQIEINPNIKRGIFTNIYWKTIENIRINDKIILEWN